MDSMGQDRLDSSNRLRFVVEYQTFPRHAADAESPDEVRIRPRSAGLLLARSAQVGHPARITDAGFTRP